MDTFISGVVLHNRETRLLVATIVDSSGSWVWSGIVNRRSSNYTRSFDGAVLVGLVNTAPPLSPQVAYMYWLDFPVSIQPFAPL
ncbi:MAG: hypothetical protein KatS3mg059_1747 [Thermomicrobiales bacterium]|nr:MAG: hypothetical protein KatS3mg059_1747 [Thermomicrobiales bacterium]